MCYPYDSRAKTKHCHSTSVSFLIAIRPKTTLLWNILVFRIADVRWSSPTPCDTILNIISQAGCLLDFITTDQMASGKQSERAAGVCSQQAMKVFLDGTSFKSDYIRRPVTLSQTAGGLLNNWFQLGQK